MRREGLARKRKEGRSSSVYFSGCEQYRICLQNIHASNVVLTQVPRHSIPGPLWKRSMGLPGTVIKAQNVAIFTRYDSPFRHISKELQCVLYRGYLFSRGSQYLCTTYGFLLNNLKIAQLTALTI